MDDTFIEADLLQEDPPSSYKWTLPIVKKIDAHGYMRSWEIMFDGRRLITEHGRVGGAMQMDYIEIKLKSRSSLTLQAWLIAKKKYNDKLDEGGGTISIADTVMLAQTYTDQKLPYPVALQRKFDGIRFTSRKDNDKIVLKSRTNKDYYSFYHITKELELIYDKYPNIELDGELYIHGLDLQEIRSIVLRKVNKHDKIKDIDAIIFDIIDVNMTFQDRMVLMQSISEEFSYLKSVKIASTHIVNSNVDLIFYHEKFINEGYEGTIIRHLDSVYERKRSHHLLKMKPYDTYEGYITAVNGANNDEGRESGLAIFQIKWNEKTFACRPQGKFTERQEILNNKETFLEKYKNVPYTFKCYGVNQSGIPNIPIGIGFRDYE